MNRFTKKPVEIEAFQMTREHRQVNSDWPWWLYDAWQKDPNEEGAVYPQHYPNSDGTDKLMIHTLEGNHLVDWDDYIIQGVKGELYPCKPDIFEATYDVVKEFKPFTKIILIDFDGVIHSYTSGWKGADMIPDEPVPGAIDFLMMLAKQEYFKPAIYSARSGQEGGIEAMKNFILLHSVCDEDWLLQNIDFPTEKPSAFITIDDRCICFKGTFPSLLELNSFKAWNK